MSDPAKNEEASKQLAEGTFDWVKLKQEIDVDPTTGKKYHHTAFDKFKAALIEHPTVPLGHYASQKFNQEHVISFICINIYLSTNI